MPARAPSAASSAASSSFASGGSGGAGGHLLALVIDADRQSWTARASQLQDGVRFVDVLDDLLIYINAFLLLSGLNRLVVVAAHRRSTRVLYPPPETPDEAVKAAEAAAKKDDSSLGASGPSAAARPALNKVADELGHGIRTLGQLEEEDDDDAEEEDGSGGSGGGGSSMLANALSCALCHVNRFAPAKDAGSPSALKPRVLVVSCSPDDGAQYRAMMNSVFAAQRLGAPIDACCLGAADSAFLQQAAHISGGTYTLPFAARVTSPPAGGAAAAGRKGAAVETGRLYQHLLSTFLADTETRKLLQQPRRPTLDLRPACFKTKRVVDIGFVCSVCLSIYHPQAVGKAERRMAVCETCGTRFKPPERR